MMSERAAAMTRIEWTTAKGTKVTIASESRERIWVDGDEVEIEAGPTITLSGITTTQVDRIDWLPGETALKVGRYSVPVPGRLLDEVRTYLARCDQARKDRDSAIAGEDESYGRHRRMMHTSMDTE